MAISNIAFSHVEWDQDAWQELLTMPGNPDVIEAPPMTPALPQAIPSKFRVEPSVVTKTFFCHIEGCGKGYTAKYDLKQHFAKKHSSQEYLGNPEFKDKKSKEGKPFPCSYADCPSGFRYPQDLRKHLQGKHGDQPKLSESEKAKKLSKKLPCSWPACKFGFEERFQFDRHMDRKHGGKVFEQAQVNK